jgi:LDH2 family malate/lactate/ureidoglycolate dehydrogenase
MSNNKERARYDHQQLIGFANQLLTAAGLDAAPAQSIADALVEGDLLGHDTHGLQLLAGYTNAAADGTMRASGQPTVVSERSSVCVWDGQRIAGPHLVRLALDWAAPRAREHGTATVAIRRSHHIGCLAAYLEAPARDGLMCTILCSDPAEASVAPFGGTEPTYTPNPLAYGIPTSNDPIIIDISASITTNGMSNRLRNQKQTGEHQWWMDADGNATNNPAVIFEKPPGTILPLGGLDAGHKGYSMALQVEAMTAGLAGHGRADPSEGWSATVFVQVTDPEAFAGLNEFNRQTDWLVNACQTNKPRDAASPVRLPGQRGLQRKREQLEHGVALHPAIMQALEPVASKHGVSMPGAK